MSFFPFKRSIRLWYYATKPKPGKPTILLIHGWVHNHTAWHVVAKQLHEQGYGILLCDLPGHGYSSSPRSPLSYDIPVMAEACAALCQKLRLTNIVIIGHSLGGMVAQYLAPQVNARALVLVSTTYRSPLDDIVSVPDQTQHIVDEITATLAAKVRQRRKRRIVTFHKDTTDNDIITWIKGASSTDNRAILACFKAIIALDSASQLEKIKCPALAIVGTKDNRTPLPRVRKMARLIRDCQLVVVKEGRHNLNLTHPQFIAKEIQAFLRKKKI